MANVTCMEPQVLVDLLALSLEHAQLQESPPEECFIWVVSPWFTDVELALHPSGHHECLGSKQHASSLRLNEALQQFVQLGWKVSVAVLQYGQSSAGLHKNPQGFSREREVLRSLADLGADVYLCPNLHAKGIITPLGVVTGTTNYTHSGMNLQMQNALYFPLNHSEYATTRDQLMMFFRADWKTSTIP